MDIALMDLSTFDVCAEIVDKEEAEREAWFQRRLGRFTCSRFGDLMGAGRKKDDEFSQTAWSYLYQIAAERLGSYVHEFDGGAVRWGRDNEPDALLEYLSRSEIIAIDTFKTGTSCFHEFESYAGGTPDALVDADGCCEVKCPFTPQEHMRTVHENTVPKTYVWQVQGHLLVTGRNWCDFVSFDPRIECSKRLHVIRVERCEPMIETLKNRLVRANELVLEILG